jgi:hypothetical protein
VEFNSKATQLAGQAAMFFGWRPDDFWNATPAELASIVSAYLPGMDAANGATLAELMMRFPDAATEMTNG